VLPSLNVPVAVNCRVDPLTMDGLAGVTAMDCSATTVSTVLPVTPFNVALTALVPPFAPVAKPALVIVAVEVVAERHITWLVKFWVLPSAKVPVAVNCSVDPLAACV
jgi:hypothetical protein